jgi:N-acetylneuraminate synthase
MGTSVSAVAVALGASFIEKHFTLSRADGGVDSAFSLEPQELAELVKTARIAQAAVGKATFGSTISEAGVLRNRRSLYVVKKIVKGELLTIDNIRSIRPANGLKPKFLDVVLGQRANRDLEFGEPLQLDMIESQATSACEA